MNYYQRLAIRGIVRKAKATGVQLKSIESKNQYLNALHKKQEKVMETLKKYADDDPIVSEMVQKRLSGDNRSKTLVKNPLTPGNLRMKRSVERRKGRSSVPLKGRRLIQLKRLQLYMYDENPDQPLFPEIQAKVKTRRITDRFQPKFNSEMVKSIDTQIPPVQQKQKPNITREKQNPLITPEPQINSSPLSESSDCESCTASSPTPLPQYYRQFRDTLLNQLSEQTSYLFRSHKENWTSTMLELFEKHDKQMWLLRKRTRYLEFFDRKFFSGDPFLE